MSPTRRAEALSEPLALLLGGIEDFVLEPWFDPAASDRVFQIATTDYGALAKDYELLVETGEMLLYLAMSRILLRRLTRNER